MTTDDVIKELMSQRKDALHKIYMLSSGFPNDHARNALQKTVESADRTIKELLQAQSNPR